MTFFFLLVKCFLFWGGGVFYLDSRVGGGRLSCADSIEQNDKQRAPFPFYYTPVEGRWSGPAHNFCSAQHNSMKLPARTHHNMYTFHQASRSRSQLKVNVKTRCLSCP